MDVGDDLTKEVPLRLSTLCHLYEIDQSDPLWERRLLMTLLARHVPGFGQKMPRLPDNDDAFTIDIIDAALDHYEQVEGRRPPVESVVVELVADKTPQWPIAGKSKERLLRIYSGRNASKTPDNKVAVLLSKFMASSKALREAAPDSHAALLHEAIKRRSSAKR